MLSMQFCKTHIVITVCDVMTISVTRTLLNTEDDEGNLT